MSDHRSYAAEQCEERCVVDNEIWPCETIRLRERVAKLERDLTAFYEECDKVAIPHDAAGLVRHHRGNAGLAASCETEANILEALPEEMRTKVLDLVHPRSDRPVVATDTIWAVMGMHNWKQIHTDELHARADQAHDQVLGQPAKLREGFVIWRAAEES